MSSSESVPSISSIDHIRSRGDLALHKELLEAPEVQQVRNEIESSDSPSARRQLLSTALRLTPGMSPKLAELLDSCAKTLNLDMKFESYVYNSADFNAACIKPENGTLLLMFSSSLLQGFNEKELKFVMGHEIGHYLCGHHDIPVGYLVKGPKKVGVELAVKLFTWSRYAEISADRAGAICAGDPDATASALFKLSSGITSDLITVNVEEFVSQVDEIVGYIDPKSQESQSDWFMTHPFTPLRVKALQAFSKSKVFAGEGAEDPQLNADIEELMALMSPSYLQQQSDDAKTMRSALFASMCGLMNLDGKISDEEKKAFEEYFGEGSLTESLDFDRIAASLDDRITLVNSKIPTQRRQFILRDLCVLGQAANSFSDSEKNYVRGIAKKFELSDAVAESTISQDIELD